MAKFVVVVDVENESLFINTEFQKNDVMVALRSLLLDSEVTGVMGDQYHVVSVPEVYFPF